MDLSLLFTILNLVCGGLFVACYAHQIFYVFYTLFKKHKTYPETDKTNRYAVLICGRNEENGNNSAREGNYNVSNGTWCCTTRNVLGANQASANIAVNNNTNCSCENNNGVSDPVIILTNNHQINNLFLTQPTKTN